MFQKIKEIKHFRDALKDIHFDTWLILDLDNTVMTPRLELGGDAWFSALFDHLAEKEIDERTALPWLMSVYNAVQHFIRTEAVEPKIITLIKALQDIGVPVIGLTARGYCIRQQTIRQLADMGIDFSRNTIVQDDGNSRFGGVIFCSGKDKGDELGLFFSQLSRVPRHVCMLDDKRKHLEHVMRTLAALGVSFSGSRYAFLDEVVKQFKMEIANIQLAHLWTWLSTSVQRDLINLALIPDELQGVLSPERYADHFFHPDSLLNLTTKPTLEDLLDAQQSKLLTRSMSSASFFHEKNKIKQIDVYPPDIKVSEYTLSN